MLQVEEAQNEDAEGISIPEAGAGFGKLMAQSCKFIS